MNCRGLLLLGLLALLGVGAACGPPDLSGSVRAEVMAMVGPSSQHALSVQSVENLESLRELRGRDVEFRAGAILRQDGSGGLSASTGSPFALDYDLDAEGVVRASSLTSVSALSLYRDLDLTAAYLRRQGYQPTRRLMVFYSPNADSAVLGDLRALFIDNAGYAAAFHAYFVMPSLFLQALPLSLNLGVVAHEYGHAVQQQLVLKDSSDNHAQNLPFASANEGVADLIGYVVSGDPNFIFPSAPVDRNLATPLSYTEADATELRLGKTTAGSGPDPHRHGSLMARAVFEMWPKQRPGELSADERDQFARSILSALGKLEFSSSFGIGTFPNALLGELPASALPAACAVLTLRLQPFVSELTRCQGVRP